MKLFWRNSIWVFILLALSLSLLLASCAPAATPAPAATSAPAAVPTSAPFVTESSAPTESNLSTPAPAITETLVIVPTKSGQPTQAATELAPALQEMRLLTLDYPPRIRAGDSDVISLTLEMDENGNLKPTVSQAGNISNGQTVYIPNVFDTYNILAEARLEMAGLDVRPNEIVSEPLTARQKVTFYWSVLPNDVGVYKGVVWFYLHFIPKTSGVESRKTLSSQVVEIEATSFAGLRANPTRWLGLAGTVVSSVLGMPFLESILKYLWKRLRGANPGSHAGSGTGKNGNIGAKKT